MSVGPPRRRRTQAERREATVGALVEAARRLFAEDGFQATSLDAVAARAGLTKGAVYHHFDGKRQLFEAVFAHEVAVLTAVITAEGARRSDPWQAFRSACHTFLEACLEPGLQRIVLLDAFAAIGWEAIRRHEQGLMELMEHAIDRAVQAGRIEPRPAGPLAAFLYGGLCEAAMVVARAPDQVAAQQKASIELDRILDSLSVRQMTDARH